MTQHSLNLRLMSPTSPESSDQSPPSTPASTSSPSESSCDSSFPETPDDSPRSDTHQEVSLFKENGTHLVPVTQVLIHRPWTEEPPALAYVVSLLHALPFIFRAETTPTITRGEFPEPLDLLKLTEKSRELALTNPHGRIPIPSLVHPLFVRHHRRRACIALRELPITLPIISISLTLLSAIYPYQYGWNHHVPSPISPTTLIPPTPASKSTSLTDALYYYQLGDGIIIHKGESTLTYKNKTYIPTRIADQDDGPSIYPYGWTQGIKDFCQQNDHHPDCLDPIRRAFIEREFIASVIKNPDSLATLDEYLQTIQANTIGYNLQWLLSSPTPVKDDVRGRIELTRLYSEVDNQDGRVFHTKKGLCITIPEEKWVNWRMHSPSSQKNFVRVAWAQLTQFDKTALMTGLIEGKIGPRPVYLDFDDEAEHYNFPHAELDSVRQYYIELIAQTGAYRHYNQYVMQELAHDNEPNHLPLTYNWATDGRPRFVFLPYSRLLLTWNKYLNRWEYESHCRLTLSSCSDSSYAMSDESSPSLLDPIDEFEAEERATK